MVYPIKKIHIFNFFCGLLFIYCLCYLIFGEKPWESGIQHQIKEQKKIKYTHYVSTYLWQGAIYGQILALTLLIFSKKIVAFLEKPKGKIIVFDRIDFDFHSRFKKYSVIALALSLLISIFFQIPRLDHSMADDELESMRNFMVGEYKRKNTFSDEFKFYKRSLFASLYNYKTTNNHVLYSFFANLSHRIVGINKDPHKPYFSETALRTPAFIASILAIIVIFLLFYQKKLYFCACVAPLLLGSHLWLNRYGTEARGYTFFILFSLITLYSLIIFLENAKWRWAIIFCFAQVFAFLSYIASLYLLIFLHCFFFIILLKNKHFLVRYIFANLISICVLIVFFLPIFPQLLDFLEGKRLKGEMGFSWIINCAFLLNFGINYFEWEAENPFSLVYNEFLQNSFTFYIIPVIIALIIFATAFLSVKKYGKFAILSFILAFFPLPLMFIHTKSQGNYLYLWYAILALWPFIIWQTLGISYFFAKFRKKSPFLIFLSIISLISILNFPSLKSKFLMQKYPIQASKESVLLTKNIINTTNIKSNTISVGLWHPLKAYDYTSYLIKNIQDFQKIIQIADAKNKDLFLNIGNYGLGAVLMPDIFEIINNEKYFKKVKIFHGFIQPSTRLVLQYNKNSFKPLKN